MGHQILALDASLQVTKQPTEAKQAELHALEADSAWTVRWVSWYEMHEKMSYDAYL